jgi:hypothetical protein
LFAQSHSKCPSRHAPRQVDPFCYPPVLNVEKLAHNQNDFVRYANRGCWLGLDGAISQAAIRVVDSGLSVRFSRVPQPSFLRLRVLTFARRSNG